MTRDSRAWRWIGFLIALVGVGFPYWQLAPEQAGLPRALYGPGLVAVGVIAMLLRAFGTGRFLTLWLLIAAAVPGLTVERIALVEQQIGRQFLRQQAHGVQAPLGRSFGVGFALRLQVGQFFVRKNARTRQKGLALRAFE